MVVPGKISTQCYTPVFCFCYGYNWMTFQGVVVKEFQQAYSISSISWQRSDRPLTETRSTNVPHKLHTVFRRQKR